MVSDLTLEFLSCAEGRFLSIHPFQDLMAARFVSFCWNCSAALICRAWCWRLNLPGIAPFISAALESADQRDFRPLMEIWRQRFHAVEPIHSNMERRTGPFSQTRRSPNGTCSRSACSTISLLQSPGGIEGG